MRVLVTGAFGFIGSHVVSALHAAGHEVLCAARQPDHRFAHLSFLACDLARDTRVDDWLPRLANVDAVVNAAGILRENRRAPFAAVHHAAPLALFQACARAGVRKVVQISALGDPRDGEFIASKHALDTDLSKLDLDWVILRPSVVYSAHGSYGGTSLLRALAALPWILAVPGNGQHRLQPIVIEDLAQAVRKCVEGDKANRLLLEAAGPEPVAFESFLGALRGWLGIPTRHVWHVPLAPVRWLAQLGERFGAGPLGVTMYRMLERGNVASPGAIEALVRATGVQPRGVDTALGAVPSQVQDRWHARLYLLAPLLRLSLAFLFVFSGIAGFSHPVGGSIQLLGYLGISAKLAPAVVYLASAIDISLGALLLTRHQRPAAIGMLLMVVAYTAVLGFKMPGLWLEPFGALIKNIPLIPAVLAYLVLSDRR